MDSPNLHHKHVSPISFSRLFCVQISFSKDGIFISIGAYCETATNPNGQSFYPNTDPGIMSTLFAYSKAALYDCENTDPQRKIYAATYLGPFAWKSSISYKEQSLIKEEYRTFNNLITPARPQDEEDIKEAPLFVMKVSSNRQEHDAHRKRVCRSCRVLEETEQSPLCPEQHVGQ
jgi:hypothetical protein